MKLKDVAIKIGSGLTPSRSNPLFWNASDLPWIKTEQLGAYEIEEAAEYISQFALDNTSIHLWPKGTISVAMYGEGQTRGKASILNIEATTNQACCNIVCDPKKADYKYLYYWLTNNYPQLRRLSSGVRKNLNSNDIKNFPFPSIGIDAQNQISKLLSTIDDKIVLNKKVIKELEEAARLIYDYWFTQFDFPDENGKPYRSSGGKMVWNDDLKREIPEGWTVSTVKNLASVTTGKEDANFASDDGIYKFFTCAQDPLSCPISAFEGSAVLIAGNGDFNVKHFSGEFNAYQRTYVLIPFKPEFYYPIYTAAKKRIETFSKGSAGSIVKFITKGDVENIPIVVPSDLGLFSFFNNTINRIESIDKESEELTKLRDWLLPMLMNGQVNVN